MATVLVEPTRVATRRFYIGAGVSVIVLSIAGFGPSLIDTSKRTGPPTLLVISHGTATFLWLLAFLTQSMLIAKGRKAVHRSLGVATAILAIAVVVLGLLASAVAQRRGGDLSGDLVKLGGGQRFTPDGIIGPILLFSMFGAYVAAAFWCRHRPEIHKRLMVFALGTLGREPVDHLFGYSVAYWPWIQPAIAPVTLLAVVVSVWSNAIHDWIAERRIHPASLWVAIASMVFFNGIFFGVAQTSAWVRFSEWLIDLVPASLTTP